MERRPRHNRNTQLRRPATAESLCSVCELPHPPSAHPPASFACAPVRLFSLVWCGLVSVSCTCDLTDDSSLRSEPSGIEPCELVLLAPEAAVASDLRCLRAFGRLSARGLERWNACSSSWPRGTGPEPRSRPMLSKEVLEGGRGGGGGGERK